ADRLRELLAWADVLIHDLAPDAPLAPHAAALGIPLPGPGSSSINRQLSAINSSLIVTAISPFGLSGPRAGWRGSDLVAFPMGGYGRVVGGPVDDPDREPPLKAAGRPAELVAGVNAALATLAAVRARARSGRGQLVDVSMQAALVPFVFGELARLIYDRGVGPRRRADNPPNGTVAVLPP